MADMLKFRKGTLAQINAAAKVPGTIYIAKDEKAMYDATVQIGWDNTIWQNRIVYAICKTLLDILEWIRRNKA